MGTIKDRNNEDLTEAEAIKKRWQECTDPNDQVNHQSVVTHLESRHPGV